MVATLKESKLKAPPHSIEAEQSVLGGLMLDNQAWDKVSEIIQEKDFYRAQHRLVFAAMAHLIQQSQPLDMLTVTEALKQNGQLKDAGGELYIFDLANNTPNAANIAAYATIVHERSVLRQLVSVANDISDAVFAHNGQESQDILDQAERLVFGIAEHNTRGAGPVGIQDYVAQSFAKIDKLYHSDDPITGMPTGFTDLDNMTSGLQASDLVIVAGRPSMGKTVLGMNIAEHVAFKIQQPVLIFSMEMPGDQIAMRMLSSWGRINQHKLRTGKLSDDDWPRLTGAMSALNEMPIFVDDTPGLSPQELRSRSRRIAREHGQLGLIVVDYLQLMKIPGFSENRTGEISEISRSLKALAKELKVPVVALSQLNRSLEQRHDKRPIMSDLRESGAIEQDADLITFIYRDEVYNEDTPDKGKAEIIIAKQRNGPIGRVILTFLGEFTKFENYAPLENPYS